MSLYLFVCSEYDVYLALLAQAVCLERDPDSMFGVDLLEAARNREH